MDIASLGLAVRSDQVEKASDALQRFTGEAGKAQGASDKLSGSNSRVVTTGNQAAAANDNVAGSARRAAVGYEVMGGAARVAIGFITALTGALATGALVSYADAWSDMQSRVGAAVRDMEAAPALMQRMVDIANASYSPLEQTVETYARNVAVLREMGGSAEQAADFTESLNNALVITATRGERAASVTSALSKAMAVGKLQADGLETVLANGGAVAEALAEELGTTVNGLRKMASDGKITGDVIANSLINRLQEFRDRAAEMPATVGDAFVRLQTNITAFVGQLDQATGASETLAGALIWVADNIELLTRIATVAGTAILVAMGPAILSQIAIGFGYLATAGVSAINAITVAMARNPLGLLAVAVSTAIVALYQFRDEARSVMGDQLFNIVKTGANYLINSFRAAYEDLKFIFSNFGDVVGGAVIGGVNAIIRAINDMIQGAAGRIDFLINAANKIPGVAIPTIGTIGGIGELANPSADRLRAGLGGEIEPGTGRVSGHIGNIQRIMATDNFASGADSTAEASRSAADALGDLNSALGSAGNAATTAGRAIGAAANDNVDPWKGLRGAVEETGQSFSFARDLVGGFMSDVRSNLGQGQSIWESFANAAVRSLDKVIDRISNGLLDSIFQVNGAVGGGGGGFLSNIFGSIFGGGQLALARGGGIGLYDTGGWTGSGNPRDVAGLVHKEEFVVKAGPARRNLAALTAMNNGAAMPANGNAAPAINDNRVYHIDARGAQQGVGVEIQRALEAYDAGLPDRLKQIEQFPRRR
jgi:tape measure domain-containing protein